MAARNTVEVPVVWLRAEQTAGDLIGTSRVAVPPATFEFRATRDVLALTLFLGGVDLSVDGVPVLALALVRDCLARAPQWLTWCQLRLATPDPATAAADTGLARNAWQWLACGRLPPATGQSEPGTAAEPAWQVGLSRARRILDEHLTS